ncbi:sugar ABC transporter permease [Nakamurella flavida]|uniref:Sugar ABC transporter permease n=1 Tax=Nakamurella flavida TaxID=363630 RepID=A0A938YNP6_9ACTN|nr:sugar ABC transporter permease [Nakamurella flavida]MBM9478083.1 sugar ABC transporter permease [Nakamurella flavida]MDP9778696.1 raffinose/stachyose/melibiose transport system permease protein [Nakamurella flavida]
MVASAALVDGAAAVAPGGSVASAPTRGTRRRDWKGYLYVLPAFVVFAVFLGMPLLQTVWYSFWNWNGFGTATWAGLDNYTEIVSDPSILRSFGHSGVLIVFYSFVPVAVALMLTAILSRSPRLRGLGLFRTLLFLPQVIASVVVATSWIAIYSPDGLINQGLRAVGLEGVTRAWLGDFDTALPAIGLVGTWLGIGLCLVLFLSGVATIDGELFEAVRLDGAGLWREFFAITLPAIRGHIVIALTLTIVAALKTFDLVYVTTRGGPGSATTVPAFEAYNRAFNTREVGSASAIAVTLTVVILLITLAVSRLQPKEDPR